MDAHYQEMLIRWRALAATAANIIPTKIPLEPTPGEIKKLIDDLDAISRVVDPVVASIAEYLEASTGHKIDRKHVPVDHVLRDALDGMLIYEIESAADALADELQQAAYHSKHNHMTAAE